MKIIVLVILVSLIYKSFAYSHQNLQSSTFQTENLILLLNASNFKNESFWIDDSSNKNNATFINSPPYRGNSFSFNGKNQYASMPLEVAFDNGKSIFIVARMDALTCGIEQYRPLIAGIGSSGFSLSIFHTINNTYQLYYSENGNTIYSPDLAFSTDTWFSVSISQLPNGETYFYFNGNLIFTAGVEGIVENIMSFTIATDFKQPDLGYSYWKGDIALIALYSFPLEYYDMLSNHEAIHIAPDYIITEFTPATIKGCNLWLDSTDPMGDGSTLENGILVNTWKDKSGQGNDAEKSLNSLSSPFFDVKGIFFDGNTFYNLPDGTISPGCSNYTIFAACRPMSSDGVKYVYTAGNAYNEEEIVSLAFSPLSDYYVDHKAFINFSGYVFVSTFDGLTRSFYKNGTLIMADNSVGLKTIATLYNFIGAKNGQPTYSGYIHEIIVYNYYLSSELRDQVTNYLMQKYESPADVSITTDFTTTFPTSTTDVSTSNITFNTTVPPLNNTVPPATPTPTPPPTPSPTPFIPKNLIQSSTPATISQFTEPEFIFIQFNNETVNTTTSQIPVDKRIQVNITGFIKLFNNTDALFFDAKYISTEENGTYQDRIFPYKNNKTFFTPELDQDPFTLEFLVNNQSVAWATEVAATHTYSVLLENLTNPFSISINAPPGLTLTPFGNRRREVTGNYSINSTLSVTASVISVTIVYPEPSDSPSLTLMIVVIVLGTLIALLIIMYFRHFNDLNK